MIQTQIDCNSSYNLSKIVTTMHPTLELAGDSVLGCNIYLLDKLFVLVDYRW